MQPVGTLYCFRVLAVAAMLVASACGKTPPQRPSMNNIAEQYVRLILAIGQHDANYVDAYYGPEEWKPAAKEPLPEITTRLRALTGELERTPEPADEMERLRREY